MNDNRLEVYLDHMREAAADACGFVEGMDKPALLRDKRTQQAFRLDRLSSSSAATLC